ncbi:MAG: hypothetical protein JSS32_05165 [Verrucomicrobia bacterium]|nr:hypothetical protein [Verrucomicrobiota bacterium]
MNSVSDSDNSIDFEELWSRFESAITELEPENTISEVVEAILETDSAQWSRSNCRKILERFEVNKDKLSDADRKSIQLFELTFHKRTTRLSDLLKAGNVDRASQLLEPPADFKYYMSKAKREKLWMEELLFRELDGSNFFTVFSDIDQHPALSKFREFLESCRKDPEWGLNNLDFPDAESCFKNYSKEELLAFFTSDRVHEEKVLDKLEYCFKKGIFGPKEAPILFQTFRKCPPFDRLVRILDVHPSLYLPNLEKNEAESLLMGPIAIETIHQIALRFPFLVSSAAPTLERTSPALLDMEEWGKLRGWVDDLADINQGHLRTFIEDSAPSVEDYKLWEQLEPRIHPQALAPAFALFMIGASAKGRNQELFELLEKKFVRSSLPHREFFRDARKKNQFYQLLEKCTGNGLRSRQFSPQLTLEVLSQVFVEGKDASQTKQMVSERLSLMNQIAGAGFSSQKELSFPKVLPVDELQLISRQLCQKIVPDVPLESLEKFFSNSRHPEALYTLLGKTGQLIEGNFANTRGALSLFFQALVSGKLEELRARSPHLKKLEELGCLETIKKWETGGKEKTIELHPEQEIPFHLSLKDFLLENLDSHLVHSDCGSLQTYLEMPGKVPIQPESNLERLLFKALLSSTEREGLRILREASKAALDQDELNIHQDIEEFLRGFFTKGHLTKLGPFQFSDTASWEDLLFVGKESGGCLSIDGEPDKLKAALGYFDGKHRIWAIRDQSGSILARSIVKLLWSDSLQKPVILMERPYSRIPAQQIKDALVREAIDRAKELGLPLVVKDAPFNKYIALKKKLKGEIRSFGSLFPGEHTDAAGGYKHKGIYSIRHPHLLSD